MITTNLNKLSGKKIKSESMPGILPPVFSEFVSFTKNTVYLKDCTSACIYAIGKSYFVKQLNQGFYVID